MIIWNFLIIFWPVKLGKNRKFRTFSHVLLHKFWNFYLFWTSQSKVHFQGNIPRYETPVTNEFRTFWAEMSPLINLLFIIYKSIIKLSQIYHKKLYYKKYIKIFWALMTYDNLVFYVSPQDWLIMLFLIGNPHHS